MLVEGRMGQRTIPLIIGTLTSVLNQVMDTDLGVAEVSPGGSPSKLRTEQKV